MGEILQSQIKLFPFMDKFWLIEIQFIMIVIRTVTTKQVTELTYKSCKFIVIIDKSELWMVLKVVYKWRIQ